MDAVQAQALTDAINALVAAANAQAAAANAAAAAAAPPGGGPAALTAISPFEGGAIDVNSRHGLGLYERGCAALPSKFSGKIEDIYPLELNMKIKASACYWSTGAHQVTIVPDSNGVNIDLIADYNLLTADEIEAARVARTAAGDVRAKQNALMTYECLMASLSDEIKEKLANLEDVTFHDDGPTLYFYLMSSTFKATFSSAQATRKLLQSYHPKACKYDIKTVNNYIRGAIKTLCSASRGGRARATRISNEEIFYFQFNIYKKIRSPQEWTSKILHWENKISDDDTNTITPDDLFNDLERLVTDLSTRGLWKPSDRSPEEQILAMAALKKQDDEKEKKGKGKKGNDRRRSNDKSGDDKNDDKKDDDKFKNRRPPFANSTSKLGDSKKWKGETFYYCPAKKHKHSQWHKFKVDDCKTYKKWKESGEYNNDSTSGTQNRVVVDRDKLKKGMAALFPSGNVNTDDLAEALAAALQE